MKRVVVLVVLALGLTAPSALAAATMSAPVAAKVGSHITVSASGLKPGHYTLEVSSPGLERTLRTPEHFARSIGEPSAG